MKKKTTKKSLKRQTRPHGLKAQVKELKARDMRLTQEIDRLGTEVAGIGALVGRIYGALQVAKIMPYDPIMEMAPLGTKPMPVKLSDTLPTARGQTNFGHSSSSGTRTYTVKAMMHETCLGYLSTAGDLTLEPGKIAIFGREEDVKSAIDTAKVPSDKKFRWSIDPHL